MIDLPRLEPPELAAAAAIFRRRPPLALDTPAGRLTLEVTPDGAELAAPFPFRLGLRLGEGRAVLATESGLAEALLAPALPGVELAGLDAEMHALVVELAAAPLAEAAEAALGRPVRVVEEAAPAPPAPAALPYRVGFRAGFAGGEPWPVRLELDLRGLEAVTRAFERAPVARAPLDALVLPLAVEAGRTRLPLADLARATAGDLLLLEEAPVARGRLDLVLGGVLAFACGLAGTTLSYTGEARARVADEANAAATVERLDEVPVELVFELGRLGVPLGEVRALAPGHVFDLGRDLRHPVDVLLAGRKVGEGELVQVGERVGVRLRSVVPR